MQSLTQDVYSGNIWYVLSIVSLWGYNYHVGNELSRNENKNHSHRKGTSYDRFFSQEELILSKQFHPLNTYMYFSTQKLFITTLGQFNVNCRKYMWNIWRQCFITIKNYDCTLCSKLWFREKYQNYNLQNRTISQWEFGQFFFLSLSLSCLLVSVSIAIILTNLKSFIIFFISDKLIFNQIILHVCAACENNLLTLKAPEKLQVYGLYVYYVVHICDFGMLRVNSVFEEKWIQCTYYNRLWFELNYT